MKPYAELLEFNQPNPIRLPGFTRIRDAFPGLSNELAWYRPDSGSDFEDGFYMDPERIMEFAGRGDYGEKNQKRLGEVVKLGDEQVPILRKYLDMGHHSMIEFGWATFYMEFSRVVLAELTRHRLASYQVESQRFVKYDDKGNVEGMFYFPEALDGVEGIWASPDDAIDFGDDTSGALVQEIPGTGFDGLPAQEAVESFYQEAFDLYNELRKQGVSPQDARYVLPNGFKTRMCMTANIREWRHIIGLRLDKSAQPEIQELFQQVYDQLVMVFPNALHGVLDNGRQVR